MIKETVIKKGVPVYTISMMEELVKKGYHIKYVTDNINDKKQKVFMFFYKDGIFEDIEDAKYKQKISVGQNCPTK